MTDEELIKALDGLSAYDAGCVSSGTRDEGLRQRCREALAVRAARGVGYQRLFAGRMIREMWLSEDALADGYGPEDAIQFMIWLSERMGWPLVGCAELRGL